MSHNYLGHEGFLSSLNQRFGFFDGNCFFNLFCIKIFLGLEKRSEAVSND